MDSAIMVSIITGILSLAGIIITNVSSNRKIEHQLEVHQAVTETKLENLTAEVRKHNDFAVKSLFWNRGYLIAKVILRKSRREFKHEDR